MPLHKSNIEEVGLQDDNQLLYLNNVDLYIANQEVVFD